ncbi:MAG: sigma-70 family RNA polymerase sigma factor [Deltaproteobacteria bacterium]|nr:sigma-70 family RNA polymerase sigma factor [Deltaproteobacteria bacterium]
MRTIANDPEYQRYFAEIERYPLLDRQTEVELARAARNGDKEAAERLVTSHLRFVVKVALEYKGSGLRLLDLIQEGSVGLMRAVELYDPERGNRLLTYGVHWIRAYIRSFVAKHKSVVSRPVPKSDRPKIPMGRDLSLAEHGTDDERSLEELLLVDDSETPAEALIERDHDRAVALAVERAMKSLGERERYIIRQRFLGEEPTTLQDIGVKLGLSRERVRQLEARAKARLEKALRALAPEVIDDLAVPA